MEKFFGSETEKKAGRPFFWDKVRYTDGVPDKHYAIVIWAVKTPTGRYSKLKWEVRYAFDRDKTKTGAQLIERAKNSINGLYPLPKLKPGYSYDGPYLYSLSPELEKGDKK